MWQHYDHPLFGPLRPRAHSICHAIINGTALQEKKKRNEEKKAEEKKSELADDEEEDKKDEDKDEDKKDEDKDDEDDKDEDKDDDKKNEFVHKFNEELLIVQRHRAALGLGDGVVADAGWRVDNLLQVFKHQQFMAVIQCTWSAKQAADYDSEALVIKKKMPKASPFSIAPQYSWTGHHVLLNLSVMVQLVRDHPQLFGYGANESIGYYGCITSMSANDKLRLFSWLEAESNFACSLSTNGCDVSMHYLNEQPAAAVPVRINNRANVILPALVPIVDAGDADADAAELDPADADAAELDPAGADAALREPVVAAVHEPAVAAEREPRWNRVGGRLCKMRVVRTRVNGTRRKTRRNVTVKNRAIAAASFRRRARNRRWRHNNHVDSLRSPITVRTSDLDVDDDVKMKISEVGHRIIKDTCILPEANAADGFVCVGNDFNRNPISVPYSFSAGVDQMVPSRFQPPVLFWRTYDDQCGFSKARIANDTFRKKQVAQLIVDDEAKQVKD